MPIDVPMTVLPHGEGLALPAYATEGSAGCDLRAAIEADLTIPPGGRALVPTGVALAIPAGYEGQVRMRSGLALDRGLALLNAPGTVDSDYRGELRVIVANLGSEPVTHPPRRPHRANRVRPGRASPVHPGRGASEERAGHRRVRIDGEDVKRVQIYFLKIDLSPFWSELGHHLSRALLISFRARFRTRLRLGWKRLRRRVGPDTGARGRRTLGEGDREAPGRPGDRRGNDPRASSSRTSTATTRSAR